MNSPVFKKLRLFLVIWAVAFILRIMPIGGTWDAVSTSTFLVLAVWIFIYASSWAIVAMLSAEDISKQRTPAALTDNFEKNIVLLSLIAGVGALFLAYDFSVLRGYGFSTSVADIRILEVEAATAGRSASVFSGFGRLTMPAIVAAWIFSRAQYQPQGWPCKIVLYASTLTVVVSQALFEGGRTFLVCMALAALFASGPKKILAKATKLVVKGGHARTYVSGAAILAFTSWIFIQRATNNNRFLETAYTDFGSGLPLTLHSDTIGTSGGLVESLQFVVMMFWVYVTHTINALDLVLNQEGLRHAIGDYQFQQIWAIAGILFGASSGFSVLTLPQVGVYVTTFGGWYIDFGYFTAYVAAAIIGGMTGNATTKFYRGETGPMAMSAPILIVMAVFAPIHSVITTIWPTLIFIWIFSSLSQSRVVQTKTLRVRKS